MMRPHPKILRLFLLVLVPFVVALIGGAIWLRGGRSVSTEDAYVKADIAQVAPEIAGRVAQVLVRDHDTVKAGAVLVKLDPAPFQLTLDKAEADLDAARTQVETARAQFFETQSELGEVGNQADFMTRQFARQQSLAAPASPRSASSRRRKTPPRWRATASTSSSGGSNACAPRSAATPICRLTNTRWCARKRRSATAPRSTSPAPRSPLRSAALPWASSCSRASS
jgi:multidrug resistance efflux pump